VVWVCVGIADRAAEELNEGGGTELKLPRSLNWRELPAGGGGADTVILPTGIRTGGGPADIPDRIGEELSEGDGTELKLPRSLNWRELPAGGGGADIVVLPNGICAGGGPTEIPCDRAGSEGAGVCIGV
jgi:hypothetical protein